MACLHNFSINMTLIITFIALCLELSCSQNSFSPSRATYYGSHDCYGTPHGACGYGEYGRTINDGYVTGACRLFGNGSGCGACYQVRCKEPRCSGDGAVVVVTDYGEGDRTDFILSPQAYSKLAQPGRVEELFACGVVDVEFRRVPCQYPGYNTLYVKVHEHSKNPHYLAIAVLYVSGINDITAAELWQEDCKEWRPMRRVFGVVFDAANPPAGPISIRFQVTSATNGVKWVQPPNPIPSDWTAGAYYNTLVQLD